MMFDVAAKKFLARLATSSLLILVAYVVRWRSLSDVDFENPEKYFEAPKKMFEDCTFPEWKFDYSEKLDGRRSYDWCKNAVEQRTQMRVFLAHMKSRSIDLDLDGVAAINFGCHLRVAYSRTSDVSMINPVVGESGSTLLKDCKTLDDDGKITSIKRLSKIKVTFDDFDFVERTVVFSGKESCVVQTLLDRMNGKRN